MRSFKTQTTSAWISTYYILLCLKGRFSTTNYAAFLCFWSIEVLNFQIGQRQKSFFLSLLLKWHPQKLPILNAVWHQGIVSQNYINIPSCKRCNLYVSDRCEGLITESSLLLTTYAGKSVQADLENIQPSRKERLCIIRDQELTIYLLPILFFIVYIS